jgi:hypothetical protein
VTVDVLQGQFDDEAMAREDGQGANDHREAADEDAEGLEEDEEVVGISDSCQHSWRL